ncbi:hypothetical protein KQI89_02245 [Clostridium sp. MSJ-4]|uniref:Uncharacterized protein n=1 Tax=Clostridium simiarum TaxID=2841506 RepID=A0ABS6EWS4_9CLOT|nr:hypothetical protein [Clostridium simiarum]
MKIPYTTVNKKSEEIKKYRYTQISAIAGIRLREDEVTSTNPFDGEEDTTQTPTTYRGVYLTCRSESNEMEVNYV